MARPEHVRCVPARRLKTELKAIVEETTKGTHTIITHNEQPVAILMPIDLDAFHAHILKQAPDYVVKPSRAPRRPRRSTDSQPNSELP